MLCSGCGNLVSEQLKYCERCGTYINLGVAADNAAPPKYAATFGYAGFWKRFVAAILDGILMSICVYIAGILLLPTNMAHYSPHMSSKQAAAYWSYLFDSSMLNLIINWLYFALMESSAMQATVGKMVLSIKVTDTEGARISFMRATARHFAKIISSITLCIGYLMAGFTEKKQALHDIITSCLVVSD
jgi:uncharacterized RDD family membrane protein YckC